VGRLWRRAAKKKRADLILSWALGVSLFVHCMSFLGVSYFGQISMLWYLSLAMIASLSPTKSESKIAAAPVNRRRAAKSAWNAVSGESRPARAT